MSGTDARLAAIQARLAAATPGPWEWDDDMWLDPGKGELYYVLWNSASVDRDRVEPVGVRPANARFIANAPEDIAWLLERLAEAEAAAAELARLNQPPTIIQCGDPADVVASKLAEAEAALDRVREVHKPIDAVMFAGGRQHPRQVCTGCGTDDGNWQIWPCPTIRTIGKEEP